MDEKIALAETLSRKYRGPIEHDLVRDYCDTKTDGDLDFVKLNIITDMVMSRLSRRQEIV